MILSRSFPPGTPIPQSISCPEEIVRVSRDGRVATVETSRPGSIAKLRRQGFAEVQVEEKPAPKKKGGGKGKKKKAEEPAPSPEMTIIKDTPSPSSEEEQAPEPEPEPAQE